MHAHGGPDASQLLRRRDAHVVHATHHFRCFPDRCQCLYLRRIGKKSQTFDETKIALVLGQ